MDACEQVVDMALAVVEMVLHEVRGAGQACASCHVGSLLMAARCRWRVVLGWSKRLMASMLSSRCPPNLDTS